MQKISRVFTLACASLVTSVSLAQSVTSVTADAPLAFGSFAPGTGGTVTISATGARSSSPGVVRLSSDNGAAASFTVHGDAGTVYSIGLPGPGTVVLSNGPNSMAVNNFTSNPSSTGLLGGGGSQTLTVGATLTVSINQASGSYTGNFTVTAVYP